MKQVSLDQLNAMVGEEVGASGWTAITQDMINRFADVTSDHQFIHVDEEAAKKTPFGGTVAHGFLTLSMLSHLAATAGMPMLENLVMGINYGFDKVRFVQPVRAGRKIRGRFTLASVDVGEHGRVTLKFGVTVEIENEQKPALVAEWLTMQVVKQ